MADQPQSIGALADAAVMQQLGPLPARILSWLRGHGAVRTLPEIWEEMERPIPELELALARLEATGLVWRRDMVTEDDEQPCWWAPRVNHPLPQPDAKPRRH